MSLNAKVGAFSTGTGSADVEVTVGFQPKAIIFWWGGRTDLVDAVGQRNIDYGFGFATSATSRVCFAAHCEDDQTNTATARAPRNDSCVNTVDSSQSVDGIADLKSMEPDGFIIAIDDPFSYDLRVHYLALGGDSITDAVCGTDSLSFNDTTISGVGFQPDLMFIGTNGETSWNQRAGGAWLGLGAGISSTQRATLTGATGNGESSSDAVSYCIDIEFISKCRGGVVNFRQGFSAMNSDGCTTTHIEAPGPRLVGYLALKGGDYKIGSLLTRDDGEDISVSGLASKPSAAFFASHTRAESTQDSADTHFKQSLGAFSSLTDRGVQSINDEQINPTDCYSAIEYDEVYANIDNAGAIQGLMDVKSIESDGFTCVMDDTDPSAALVWYVTFGPAPEEEGAEDLVPIHTRRLHFTPKP